MLKWREMRKGLVNLKKWSRWESNLVAIKMRWKKKIIHKKLQPRIEACKAKTMQFHLLMWQHSQPVNAHKALVKERWPMDSPRRCTRGSTRCQNPSQLCMLQTAVAMVVSTVFLMKTAELQWTRMKFFPDSCKIYTNRKLMLCTTRIHHQFTSIHHNQCKSNKNINAFKTSIQDNSVHTSPFLILKAS